MAAVAPDTRRVVDAVVVAVEANADALSALDAVGSDGDHAVSLTIGARAVQAALAAETAQVQNDLIRVTLANQMADAQDQAASQAILERHLAMMKPNAPSVADNIVLN